MRTAHTCRRQRLVSCCLCLACRPCPRDRHDLTALGASCRWRRDRGLGWQCRRVHATTVSLNRRLNCTDRMICRADERDDSCCSRGPVAAPVNTGILRPALPFTGPAFQPTSAALSSMGISAAASQCVTVHAVVTRLSIARAPVVPECCAATADGRWTCRGPWPTVDKPLTMIGSLPEARQKCFSTGTLTPHCASHRPEP